MFKTRFTLLFFFCFLFFFYFFNNIPAQAQSISGIEVTPSIIDESVMARDILEYTITIKNNKKSKADIYAAVNDISVVEGRQEFIEPSKLDKSTSLARWIKIKRALIEVMPGETVEVPLKIQVNMSAVPGKRHATIIFADGPNRSQAESNISKKPFPQIILNFNVGEEIIEKAQIKSFKSSKNIYLKLPTAFDIELENFGNQTIYPEGSIFIYNRQGKEVSELKINFGDEGILANSGSKKIVDWEPKSALGKYKAKLELKYGVDEIRDLQDTAYYWVLPLRMLIIFLGGILLATALLVYIIFKKTYKHQNLPANNHKTGNGVLDLRSKK